MRNNRVANSLAPTVVAQPRDTDKRVPFGRAAFEIRMPLVIHVMQQSDGFPEIGAFAAQLREMSHRISDRITVFPETFGVDPLVQNRLRASGERFTHRLI